MLLETQKKYRMAALNAKKQGDLEQARLYLRASKVRKTQSTRSARFSSFRVLIFQSRTKSLRAEKPHLGFLTLAGGQSFNLGSHWERVRPVGHRKPGWTAALRDWVHRWSKESWKMVNNAVFQCGSFRFGSSTSNVLCSCYLPVDTRCLVFFF